MIKIYQVGGSIRDELLGITNVKDIDYAVEASSYQEMIDYLRDNKYTIFVEKAEYLTARARHPSTKLVTDFTLCRKDGVYSDARRPDTVTPGTIYDDLSRRDFTANAIARDADGNIIDPFNGIKDIKARLLRCVGSTHDRLWEDSIRVLRGIRFAITKGFTMDPELHDAIYNPASELLQKISAVSVERRQQELQGMFQYNTPETILALAKLPVELINSIFTNSMWLLPTLRKIK